MTGGIVQLVAYGKEDLFLTRDPQITFFKVIYRRHTNFSREEIEQQFVKSPDFGKKSSCIVSSEGDLINHMTLKITLPEISKNILSGPGTPTQIAWIRNIGHAMIRYIEIEINGKMIDRHYGEWMHIWSTLTTKNITDQGMDKLIGNVPELTSFRDSLDEYVLYIPLYFWFCRTPGLALPLISLQYSDVKINVEFYDFEKCVIISPTHYIECTDNIVPCSPYEYLSQTGPNGTNRYGIFSYYDTYNQRLYYTPITNEKFTNHTMIRAVQSDYLMYPAINAMTVSIHRRSLKKIKLKECVLLVDYIYLDDEERTKFAQMKHDYLIEQLYLTPTIELDGVNSKVRLDINHPCKLTVWLAQLNYVANHNDRFNYTDSHIHNMDTKSLIVSESIKLNSQTRTIEQSHAYYEYIQSFQYAINALPPGCGMYSYAMLPFDAIPSGTTNMSQIELIDIYLKINKCVNDMKINFRSYSLCYNILRIDNGLCALIVIR